MQKTIKAVTIMLAFIFAFPAHASNSNGFGPISYLYGVNNGAVHFSVTTSTRSAMPACAVSGPYRWAIDASTVAGQAALSVLLTAWQTHKRVWVNGTGTCTIWSDTETVMYFNVED